MKMNLEYIKNAPSLNSVYVCPIDKESGAWLLPWFWKVITSLTFVQLFTITYNWVIAGSVTANVALLVPDWET